MTLQLRITFLIGILIYFFIIIKLVRKKTLNLKYSLLWMLTGAVLLLLDAIPEIVVIVAKVLGIKSVVNAVFAVSVFFVIIIILSLTSIVSKQTERIRNLTQSQALLEKRLRQIESIEYEMQNNEIKEKNNELGKTV